MQPSRPLRSDGAEVLPFPGGTSQEVSVEPDEELAQEQHQAVGTLLVWFGATSLVASFVAEFLLGLDLGFLSAFDAMLISGVMVLVGDALRSWEPR